MKDREKTPEPVAEPAPVVAEYPKMLYIGARRQQVTVQNAEEEAVLLARRKLVLRVVDATDIGCEGHRARDEQCPAEGT